MVRGSLELPQAFILTSDQGLSRALLLLLVFSILASSAALPTKDNDLLTSATHDIATALNADHASFEPSLPDRQVQHDAATGSHTLPTLEHSVRHKAAASDGTPNTDPYKWELCCAMAGTTSCNMELTSTCRADYRFKCELSGALTSRKDSGECKKLCACYEWSEDEGKPPTVSPRAVVQGLSLEASSPYDFVDYARKVPREEARIKEDDEPSALLSDGAQMLKTDAKLSTQSEEATRNDLDSVLQDHEHLPGTGSPETSRLSKRHNYALVCELDNVRDNQITRSCAAAPRYYSCDKFGGLIKTQYDNYCDQHCACQHMNPNPLIVDDPFLTPDGRIPNAGVNLRPCTWCKRADTEHDN